MGLGVQVLVRSEANEPRQATGSCEGSGSGSRMREMAGSGSDGAGCLRFAVQAEAASPEPSSVIGSVSVHNQQEHTTPVREREQEHERGNGSSPQSSSTPQMRNWETAMEHSGAGCGAPVVRPWDYLLGELTGGGALRSSSKAGSAQKRERVYNTMFHVPWRCELLIDVGFFVCLDSFLSLFTVMPARILLFMHRLFRRSKRFQRPTADELSDVTCLIAILCGVGVLQLIDISIIYHLIRGAATVKLYVIYNVLEIFDKLCQSLTADVLQVILNSAAGVADCSNERLVKETAHFIFDLCTGTACFCLHSLIIMSQAVTVSAAITAQNNALLTMLISNNFAEIKSNVFKRLGKENLHKMAYLDIVERFHIMTHLLFVLAQNVMSAESPWVSSFFVNASKIVICEILVDLIKHSFLAKFNEIKPAAYSEFLLSLCKQTLRSQSHEVHKTLAFIPIAPACVVIRALIPLYSYLLPKGNVVGRSSILLSVCVGTYVFLLLAKVVVGIGLQVHASWYVDRQMSKSKEHPD